MNKKLTLLLFFFFISTSAFAQSKKEKAFMAALDSLNYYLQFYKEREAPLRVVSYYKPQMHMGLWSDEYPDSLVDSYYKNRYKKRKDCVFIFDERNFLVLYLKDIDTSFIKPWRYNGVRIKDPKYGETNTCDMKLLYCNLVREDNGRGGMYLQEYIILPLEGTAPEERTRKLMYFFNEAILLSRKL